MVIYFVRRTERKVEVDFWGGYLSSDGGGFILPELGRHNGLLGGGGWLPIFNNPLCWSLLPNNRN